MSDYLKELFIDEAKPALQRHSGSGGVTINNQDKTITENGTYTADEGFTGLGTVEVNVANSGGDEASVLDSLIDGSITEITSNVGHITLYAFYNCTDLETAIFPCVYNIGANAFNGCSSLTTINCPVAEQIGSHSFSDCSSLTAANFPLVTDIGGGAFNACSSLTIVDLPLVTSIPSMVFSECSNLTMVNLPLVAEMHGDAFEFCSSLTIMDFPVVIKIRGDSFNYCEALTALILRSETICNLLGEYNFLDTPIESGTGYIYVPKALIEDYKVATNWSEFATQFRALEDYTVDGTITGELDETKI